MFTSPSGLAHVHLDITTPSMQEALTRGLKRDRVRWVDSSQNANVVISPFERVRAEGEPAVPIALIGKRLEPAHAALLRRPVPALLLANREEGDLPSAWEMDVLGRLLVRDELLGPAIKLERYYVGQVAGLRQASGRAIAHATDAGAPKAVAESVGDVLYELAANALLDAPAASGTAKYAHRRDDPELTITADDTAVVGMGVHEGRIYLMAFDRFGRFSVDPVARTVEGLAGRAKVNDSGGGAGLGLRRIIEQSDLFAVRVAPQRSTEVLAVIELRDVRRRAANPKSLFFCIERG